MMYSDGPVAPGGGAGLLYAAGGVPYTFHNGLAMFNPLLQHHAAGPAAGAAASAFTDAYALAALPPMVSNSATVIFLYFLAISRVSK